MKKLIAIAILGFLTANGCSFVSVPVISNESETSVTSKVSEVSTGSDLSLPSCEFCLTDVYTFEVNVMTTTDWQSFQDDDSSGTKTFSLTFPESWIRDAEGASTFHDEYTDIKIFESIAAVKLSAGFDFAGSFIKSNFEDSMFGTLVIGDITIGKLAFSDGEKTYAKVVQSVIPEGGGEIQIDRWYPHFVVIVDGNYGYCMQFYSLDDPAEDPINAELFQDIMSTFKVVS